MSDIKTRDYEYFLKHPQVVFIVGGRGAGKTVETYNMLDYYHNQKVPTLTYVPRSVNEWAKKHPDFPHKCVNIQYEYFYLWTPDTATMFDEAQIHAHAREWHEHVPMDVMQTQARKRKTTLLYVTQETFRIDRNIIGGTDVMVFKKPGLMAAKMERSEIRKQVEMIRDKFIVEVEGKGLDSRKYAWVVCDAYEGWIGPHEPPVYWSKELGDW